MGSQAGDDTITGTRKRERNGHCTGLGKVAQTETIVVALEEAEQSGGGCELVHSVGKCR